MPMLLTKLMASGVPPGMALALGSDVADNQTAVGTTQLTAHETSTAVVRYTSVASGTGSLLDNGANGDSQFIVNDGANTLAVYPHVGGSINGLGTNAAFSIPAGAWAFFDRITNTRWVAGNDAANSVFLPSGTGAIATTVQTELRDFPYNVKRFGAIGDGSTDDSAAILACVNAAAGQTLGAYASVSGVYVPPGIYKLSSSACLTPTITTSIRAGIQFFGAGMHTSILRLAPSGSDLYFYNNVATARAQFCTFSDLGFEGVAPASLAAYTDISNNAKGFRLWATIASGSHEQGFRFTRCRFFGLHTMFETAGDNTTSENMFVQCHINQIKSVVLKTDNIQSFNHEFHACEMHDLYGDVFQVSTNGGGAIKMYGGSVIMDSAQAVDCWFFHGTGSSGQIAGPFVFDGVRFEIKGNTTNLVSLTDAKQFHLNFNNCNLYDTATSAKASWCKIGSHSVVHFLKCGHLEASGDYSRVAIDNSGGGFAINGEIIFDGCQLPLNFSDKCSLADTYGSGLIRAINCFGPAGSFNGATHYAHDFDLHGIATNPGAYATWPASGTKDSGSPSHAQWILKVAQIKLPTDYWPDITEHTLRMPKNAILVNMHLRKPAGGVDATATIFRIGRADKSGTDHLVSDSQRMDAAHTGDATNLFYFVGSTDNERNLLLYTDENPAASIQGGLCIVEYY